MGLIIRSPQTAPLAPAGTLSEERNKGLSFRLDSHLKRRNKPWQSCVVTGDEAAVLTDVRIPLTASVL